MIQRGLVSLNMNSFFHLKLKTGGGVIQSMEDGRTRGRGGGGGGRAVSGTVHDPKIQRVVFPNHEIKKVRYSF